MQFAIFKQELEITGFSHAKGKRFNLDSSTSVAQQKIHLLDELKKLGTIIPLSNNITKTDFKNICSQSDTIVVTVHHNLPWDDVPRRLLLHSLGDFMLTPVYFQPGHFFPNTINLVTSQLQKKQLERHLGAAAPALGVFTPKLKEDRFYPPTIAQKNAARKKTGITNKTKHIVYAGRWLSNKGICQLIRALNLWPLEDVVITLAGNFEPNFVISQSNTNHCLFEQYFLNEFISKSKVKINLLKAHGPDCLRELLWSADLFVYASIHEDENFGMAPREAVLCGVPVVVTDFCGLGQLGKGVGGLIHTYSTLAGPRYSLKELRDTIHKTLHTTDKGKRLANIQFVTDECDPRKTAHGLKKYTDILLKQPLADIPHHKQACHELLGRLMQHADSGILQAIIEKNRQIPDGLLVYGTGNHNKEYAYHRFLAAVQGFYTTHNHLPDIAKRSRLRGFWRLGLWPQEKALVEFGFPGPRMKRYNETNWQKLTSCITTEKGELILSPSDEHQIDIARELMDLGYFVLD